MTTNPPRTIRGRLDYFREDGSGWGRENFSMTEFAGGRTYRSCQEMDDLGIFRDGNWSMTPDMKPLEGFSRETVDGQTVAHSWFRIDGANAQFETFGRDGGRASQTVTALAPIGHLGIHLILSDCMVSAARGFDDPGAWKTVTCLANSLDGYGRGTSEVFVVQPEIQYVGTERVTVPAGEFDGEHFVVRWSEVVPAPSHFWVLRDSFIPLRLEGASDPVTYELAEISL